MVEEMNKPSATLDSVIEQMNNANERTAELCRRLSVVVDKLLIGVQPSGPTGTNGQACAPLKGDLTILMEGTDLHFAINRRFDELVSQLELSITSPIVS